MNSGYGPLLGEAQQCCPEQDKPSSLCGSCFCCCFVFIFLPFVCLFARAQGRKCEQTHFGKLENSQSGSYFLSTAHQRSDFVPFIFLFPYRSHDGTHTRILSHCFGKLFPDLFLTRKRAIWGQYTSWLPGRSG